jgi:hypothetical protein
MGGGAGDRAVPPRDRARRGDRAAGRLRDAERLHDGDHGDQWSNGRAEKENKGTTHARISCAIGESRGTGWVREMDAELGVGSYRATDRDDVHIFSRSVQAQRAFWCAARAAAARLADRPAPTPNPLHRARAPLDEKGKKSPRASLNDRFYIALLL